MQGPPVLKTIFGSLRGFAGQISPAAALDAVSTDGNVVIIDIRWPAFPINLASLGVLWPACD